MASWTDKTPPTFNPYIQQLPVEAMVEVGMHKQQQYNEGIQKIQSSLDNIAGLDVIRDVDKVYLQSKLNEVGNNLKTVAAGDFSNFQLSNSVAGMANKISKDKNVLNAINSTQKYRKEIGVMEEAKKKGELTPDNEFHFSKKATEWLNSNDLSQTFNASYVPYFDVFKFAKETFDEIQPDGYSFDQIYQLDADGQPVLDKRGRPILSEYMTRLEKEGKFPEKVQQAISQIFSDPRVGQQLQISGEYNYRGYDYDTLNSIISTRKKDEIEEISIAIDKLNLQKTFATAEKKEEIEEQISNLNTKLITTGDRYDKMFSSLEDNPDSIRGLLYKGEVGDRYLKMFTNVKTKTQIMDNPAFRIKFDMQKEANLNSRWAQEFSYEKQRDVIKDQQWASEQELEWTKLSKKIAGIGTDGSLEQTKESNIYSAITAYQAQLDNAATLYTNTSNELVYEMLLNNQVANAKLDNLLSKGISRENAIAQVISDEARSKGMDKDAYVSEVLNNIEQTSSTKSPREQDRSPLVKDLITQYKQSKKFYQLYKEIEEGAPKILEDIDVSSLEPETINVRGKNYNLSPSEMLDLAIYLKSTSMGMFNAAFPNDEQAILQREGQLAKQRLIKRGKGDMFTSPKGWGSGRGRSGGGFVLDNLGTVKDMYNSLGDKYEDNLKQRSEYLRGIMYKDPNLKGGIVTGDNESDKKTLADIKRISGEYVANKNNISPTMKEFNNIISGADSFTDIQIGETLITDENGNLAPTISIYKGKEEYQMAISEDEARTLGIGLNIFESPTAKMIKTKINLNKNGSTTKKDIGDLSTYVGDDTDYFLDTNFFTNLDDNGVYDAKLNLKFKNGQYYPYLFVRKNDLDTGTSYNSVEALKPRENLDLLLQELKMKVNPATIEIAIQNLKNKR